MTEDDASVPVERRSLQEEARQAAERERRHQSERAGRDVGDIAYRNWMGQHWRGFLLARWMEHLQGVRYWVELRPEDFGLLKRATLAVPRPDLDELFELLRSGGDNLIVCRWTAGKPPEVQSAIIELLSKINMNSQRLRCTFEDDASDASA